MSFQYSPEVLSRLVLHRGVYLLQEELSSSELPNEPLLSVLFEAVRLALNYIPAPEGQYQFSFMMER